jgi:ABC-type phosphate/phosphonate transport system ATPase subunit
VALARALYSGAGMVVADNPLAALDPRVARWVLQRALQGELVRGRSVVVATQSPACLQVG